MPTFSVETLAEYYARNMTTESLIKMQYKGPTWKQLQLYGVSSLEWYRAVDIAIRSQLNEIHLQEYQKNAL